MNPRQEARQPVLLNPDEPLAPEPCRRGQDEPPPPQGCALPLGTHPTAPMGMSRLSRSVPPPENTGEGPPMLS